MPVLSPASWAWMQMDTIINGAADEDKDEVMDGEAEHEELLGE